MGCIGFFIVQEMIYDEQFVDESMVKIFRNYEDAINYCSQTLMQYEAEAIFEQADDGEDDYFKVLVKDKEEQDLWFIIHKGSINIA